ncbi:MAG TPA: HAD-IA family hydrolase [Albitalea sp.]|uniref:HAD family hydrolase n=1 Tax=Piscinibacter sp. TaxID=1903157 RepID=UPI002ED1F88B
MNTFPVRALTLDLDDTLWPIAPAIARAETVLFDWLRVHAPATAARFDILALRERRDEVSRTRPDIAHDFSAVRRESLRLALADAGDDEGLAVDAFEVFFAARHELEFFPEVEHALERLAARYPLLALSNGNAQIGRTAVAPWFRGAISASEFGIGKPDPRIFHEACRRLGHAPHEVLHVGDDLVLDALAARSAGLQAFWLRREPCEPAGTQAEGMATVACLQTLAEHLGC